MSSFCGLDFGTSNSTIGISLDHKAQLVPLEANKQSLRSAIFCDAEVKSFVFGQAGIDRYLSGTPGRLMMALKSVLGSSLIEDKTLIFNDYIPYTKVLVHFIKYLKAQAEEKAQCELTQVVLGRPVHFHDTDLEKDQYAEKTLEKIALDAGFKDITFQFEPIAAAITYETTIKQEQLALIVDMGGGTSDFTIIRLKPNAKNAYRTEDVLANSGIHIAGTDFDHRLSINAVMPLLGMGSLMRGSSQAIEIPSMYYHDLTTWHTLSNLYSASTINHVRSLQNMAHEKKLLARLLKVLQQRAGHHILDAVEYTKQSLSEKLISAIDLNFIENELLINVERNYFNEVIADHIEKIIETIESTINLANVRPEDINAIFYTGGSSKIPIIRDKINALFPNAEVVQGDAFGSVGLGLTLDAERKYA